MRGGACAGVDGIYNFMHKKLNSKIPPPHPKGHPSRGELWNPESLYPYWEIPKNKLLTIRSKELRKAGKSELYDIISEAKIA